MPRSPLRACALACLLFVVAPRSAAADPVPAAGGPPLLDLRELCAADVQPEVRHCPACTPRAIATLCALRRGGFSPFSVEQIESSGDFRRITGYVLGGASALLAAGAAVALAVAFGDREPGTWGSSLLFFGGFALAAGAVGTAIAAPLVVRSGNKRLEAAEMLRAFRWRAATMGPSIQLVRRF